MSVNGDTKVVYSTQESNDRYHLANENNQPVCNIGDFAKARGAKEIETVVTTISEIDTHSRIPCKKCLAHKENEGKRRGELYDEFVSIAPIEKDGKSKTLTKNQLANLINYFED